MAHPKLSKTEITGSRGAPPQEDETYDVHVPNARGRSTSDCQAAIRKMEEGSVLMVITGKGKGSSDRATQAKTRIRDQLPIWLMAEVKAGRINDFWAPKVDQQDFENGYQGVLWVKK